MSNQLGVAEVPTVLRRPVPRPRLRTRRRQRHRNPGQTVRHHVTSPLTRHGVSVIDATPEDLPPALADRYLALEAVGRL